MTQTNTQAPSSLTGDDLLRELEHRFAKLPNKTLLALAMGGLRVRAMRSLVTMISIVLAVAFLSYSFLASYLGENLGATVLDLESRETQLVAGEVEQASEALLAATPFEGMPVADQQRLARQLGMAEVAAAAEAIEFDMPTLLREARQRLQNDEAALVQVREDAQSDPIDIEAAEGRVERAAGDLAALEARQASLEMQVRFGGWLEGASVDNEAEMTEHLHESLRQRYEVLAERVKTPGRLDERDVTHLTLMLPRAAEAGAPQAVETVRTALAEERTKRDAAELRSMMRAAGLNVETSEADEALNAWLILMAMLTCAIGIANAMLMSVTERFREIGTMKCLGAQTAMVVKLFLLESGFLGLIGAVLGFVLGLIVALSAAAAQFGGYGFTHFPWTGSGTVFFASLISGFLLAVVGALFPAISASNMKPVDALRVDE